MKIFKKQTPKNEIEKEEYVWINGFTVGFKDEKIKEGQVCTQKDLYNDLDLEMLKSTLNKGFVGFKDYKRTIYHLYKTNTFFGKYKIYAAEIMCKKKEMDEYSYCVRGYKAKITRGIKRKEIFEDAKKYYDMIETMDEFKLAMKIGSYDKFCYIKYSRLAKKLGYSEDFAKITYKPHKEQMEKLIALKNEEMGKDEMIFILSD